MQIVLDELICEDNLQWIASGLVGTAVIENSA